MGAVGDGQQYAREQLRGFALASTYYMAKAVLGFTDMQVAPHREMGEFVDGPEKRKLVIAPRGTFKSSICTVAYIIRRIVQNPNIRILLVSAAQDNATKFLTLIQDHFTKNESFRWLFPELLPKKDCKRWNKTEMEVPRTKPYTEATVTAIGTETTVVSQHYDLIVNDDLVDEKIAESETELKRVLNFYKTEEPLLSFPKENEILTVGTFWDHRDLYSWMIPNEPGLASYVRGAYTIPGATAGDLYFKERLDEPELARLKAKQGSWLFNCLYLSKPYDPEAASFKKEWLRWYRLDGELIRPALGPPIPVASLRKTMRVDPAISQDSRACRTAIVVDGVAADGRKFLLETWAKRCQPSEMFSAIFNLHDKWDCESVGVEGVAYQKAIKFFLADECVRRDRWLNIIELKVDSRKSKETRIRAMQPYCERGEMWVREDQTEFLDEFDGFPVATTDDILDAWAHGPPMWDAPLEAVNTDDELQAWQFQSQVDGRSAVTGY